MAAVHQLGNCKAGFSVILLAFTSYLGPHGCKVVITTPRITATGRGGKGIMPVVYTLFNQESKILQHTSRGPHSPELGHMATSSYIGGRESRGQDWGGWHRMALV